jgi:hypothetical protein
MIFQLGCCVRLCEHYVKHKCTNIKYAPAVKEVLLPLRRALLLWILWMKQKYRGAHLPRCECVLRA